MLTAALTLNCCTCVNVCVSTCLWVCAGREGESLFFPWMVVLFKTSMWVYLLSGADLNAKKK